MRVGTTWKHLQEAKKQVRLALSSLTYDFFADAATDRGVLVHDQGRPRRNLLFPISTPDIIPEATGSNRHCKTCKHRTHTRTYGTATASGAPQKPFHPQRMVVAGATVPIRRGGTQGLLLTAMYVGSDLQFVNVPGGQSGVPVDVFANNAFDCKFEFDAAYPAIGITLNVANPTSRATKTPVSFAFMGEAID